MTNAFSRQGGTIKDWRKIGDAVLGKTIWRASLDTRHFEFEAFGDTEEGAICALQRGVDIHCEQNRISKRAFRKEYQPHIDVRPIVTGRPYRDREPL
jgi:hypothetical protein